MKINGIEYLPCEKQSKHIHPTVTGKTFAIHYVVELPSFKKYLWKYKNYNVINDMAYDLSRMNNIPYKTQLYKSTWFVLMNQPSTLVVFTKRLNDIQLGVIKFALTHGITVGLEDLASGIKQLIFPVCNQFKEPLFQKFKIEELTTEDLTMSGNKEQDEAYVALFHTRKQLLYKARKDWMAKHWRDINEKLEDITEFYKIDNMEEAAERAIRANRYKTKDILLAANTNISFHICNGYGPIIKAESKLDDPKVQDVMIQELVVWGAAFDINIKVKDTETNYATYPLKDELEASAWSSSNEITAYQYLKRVLKTKQRLSRDQLSCIVEAYLQVCFYKEHAEDFISDKYYICKNCGRPVSKKAAACAYCDTPNPEYIVHLKLNKTQIDMLKLMTPEEQERFKRKYNCEFDLSDTEELTVYFADQRDFMDEDASYDDNGTHELY